MLVCVYADVDDSASDERLSDISVSIAGRKGFGILRDALLSDFGAVEGGKNFWL